MLTIYTIQANGCEYAGSEKSIQKLLEFGLKERIEWLKKIGIEIAFAGKWRNDVIPNSAKPFFIGSDHSTTIETMHFLSKENNKIGIIHFDAHPDLETAGEKNIHNSVFTQICGFNDHPPIVKPEHVVQIGIRDFSKTELERSQRIGLIFTSSNIVELGMERIINDSLQYLDDLVDKIYVTFDLDVITPSEFPSVNTPKAGGISFSQSCYALESLYKCKKCIGGDMVEYNPIKDKNGLGAKAVFELIGSAAGYQSLISKN